MALCGGYVLYLLGHNAFRLEVSVLCLTLIPVAVSVPSLVTLAFLTLLLCALTARQQKDIVVNLDFDMIAKPNFFRFVYYGDHESR